MIRELCGFKYVGFGSGKHVIRQKLYMVILVLTFFKMTKSKCLKDIYILSFEDSITNGRN
jgi:hypothetical protein